MTPTSTVTRIRIAERPEDEHDAWGALGRDEVTWAGLAALLLVTLVAVVGSPFVRALLDAPAPGALVRGGHDGDVVLAGLVPGWWPSFDEEPFFEPLVATHLAPLPVVRANGRAVFVPARPSTGTVAVAERYHPVGAEDELVPGDIRVGDHVDVTYEITSRTRETLRTLTLDDPALGPVEIDRPLQPFATISVTLEDVTVPPRVVTEELPRLALGTDPLGRDLAARLAAGTWRMVSVALGAALLSLVLGGAAGWLAARVGRQVVTVLGRARLLLATFPFLLAASVVVLLTGASATVLVLLVAAVSAPIVGRRVRDATVAVEHSAAVETAIASGRGRGEIARSMIAPAVGRVALSTALAVWSGAVLVETSLGFLGLGPEGNAVSLGAVLADARLVIDTSAGYLILPGLLIVAAAGGGVIASEGVTRGGPVRWPRRQAEERA